MLQIVFCFPPIDAQIGFAQGGYSVGEAAGTVSVSVGVLEGELGRSVTVRLTTADGTGMLTGLCINSKLIYHACTSNSK